MQVCMKNTRFSTNIWSITAGWSRVITIWTVYYSLLHGANDRRACRRNKQYPVMNSTATHQWTIVITQATNYPKIFWPPIWRSLKNIACTKSGETHVRDIALSSIMQFFTPIGAKYLSPGKKIHIFPYRGLLWRLPSQAIHLFESSRCADFKL